MRRGRRATTEEPAKAAAAASTNKRPKVIDDDEGSSEEERNARQARNNNGAGGGASSSTSATTSALTDVHRLLLQYLIARHIVSLARLQAKFEEICTACGCDDTDQLETYLGTVSRRLHFLFMDVRKIVSENNGKVYWGLINTRSDEPSQMSTYLTLVELEYFKRMMKAIILESEGTGEINKTDALNLARELKDRGFTLKEAEDTISTFIKDKWLHETTETFSLGVRTLLELRPYLEEVYGDELVECVLCAEIVIRGQKCSNDKCTTKMHHHCARRWFAGKSTSNCPTCTRPWPELQQEQQPERSRKRRGE